MPFRNLEDRRELRWIVVATLALVALAAVPELLGRLVALPSGTLPYIGADTGVYYSYIEQVRQGHMLLRDVFTTEAQPAGFLNIFWLAVGLVARLADLGPEIVYPLTRLLFIPVAVCAVVFAVRTFLDDARERRLALFLVLFGAGFGAWWVVLRALLGMAPAGEALPVDLWVPEATLLLSALYSPHFLASFAALVATIAGAYRFARQPSWMRLALPASLLLLLGQFHPYYVPLAVGIVGIGCLALRPTGRRFWTLLGGAVLCAACGVLGMIPYGWLSLHDLTTILRNATNRTPVTDWGAMLVAGGAFLPLAFAGIWRGRKTRTPAWTFTVVWLAVQVAAVVVPIPWQRKMTEGLIVPLAMLGAKPALGLGRAILARMPRLALMRPMLTVAAFFFVFAASSAMNVLSLSAAYLTPLPTWLPTDDRAAIAWMRERLPADAVVVATAQRANGVAAFTGRMVYAGHWSETIGIDEKLAALDWLGNGARDDVARLRFLRSEHVGFVMIGSRERALWSWDPAEGEGFRQIWRQGDVAVYAVAPGSDTLGGH